MKFLSDNPKSLLEKLPEALFLEDRKGNILDANKEACELLGYEKEELLELTVDELVPEGGPAFLPDRIDDATGSGEPLETVNLRKDGTEVPVELRGRIIEVGGEERILVTIRDISKRRQAKKKHQIVIEGSSQAIYLFQDGGFKFVNESFEKLSGYTEEELNDINFLQLIPSPLETAHLPFDSTFGLPFA